MKCRIMCHFIWVSTVCKKPSSNVSPVYKLYFSVLSLHDIHDIHFNHVGFAINVLNYNIQALPLCSLRSILHVEDVH